MAHENNFGKQFLHDKLTLYLVSMRKNTDGLLKDVDAFGTSDMQGALDAVANHISNANPHFEAAIKEHVNRNYLEASNHLTNAASHWAKAAKEFSTKYPDTPLALSLSTRANSMNSSAFNYSKLSGNYAYGDDVWKNNKNSKKDDTNGHDWGKNNNDK
jgi:hypothetical protein